MRPIVRRQLAGVVAVLTVVAGAGVLVSPTRVLATLHTLTGRPLYFGIALAVAYLVRPLAAWPIVALSAVVGYVYGVRIGLPVALTGAVLTCLPAYLVARRWGPDDGPLGAVAALGRQTLNCTGDARGVATARLLPTPADAVSYGAGLAGVSLPAFLAGTLVGEIPWTVAAVLLGASADRLATVPRLDPTWVLLFAVAGAALVAPVVYRSVRGSPDDERAA